ncbi:hypothetical protein [Psychroflexus salis]|uniref:GTP-binding protein n=1 Tax=Psychroflexus salis TaxID=1526574 RepID=A0A916ZNP3_9FLAO|nr:hypothetical protein [Psychroflexus salis]GGE06568.1 hypothetical protein GCM10010831_05090 [Psychroflexus salis]
MSKPTHFDFENSVSLRVHFQLETKKSFTALVESIKMLPVSTLKKISLKVSDQHIWLGIAHKNKKMYSPNLHLECKKVLNTTQINAKFGPDPALWTLFMFLHFGLGITIISTLIMMYANFVLQKSINFQISLLILCTCIWIALYFYARYNRNRGKKQAYFLLHTIKGVLK